MTLKMRCLAWRSDAITSGARGGTPRSNWNGGRSPTTEPRGQKRRAEPEVTPEGRGAGGRDAPRAAAGGVEPTKTDKQTQSTGAAARHPEQDNGSRTLLILIL